MAMDIAAQRLQLRDVVVVDLPARGEVEAVVVRPIERTDTSVRVTLRPEGGEEFVKEWDLGEMVTVVRGP
jgi:hypothetical protein